MSVTSLSCGFEVAEENLFLTFLLHLESMSILKG